MQEIRVEIDGKLVKKMAEVKPVKNGFYAIIDNRIFWGPKPNLLNIEMLPEWLLEISEKDPT